MRDRYKLQEWRVGHAELALRFRAPVIPAAIIGAEEQMPQIARIPLGKRKIFGAPYIPVTPEQPDDGEEIPVTQPPIMSVNGNQFLRSRAPQDVHEDIGIDGPTVAAAWQAQRKIVGVDA